MRRFHKNLPIDHSVKDPAGSCRLFTADGNKICNAKLPLRSIYYHLEKIHNIKRPDDNHVLLGFDTTNIPRAVFVYKGQEKDEIRKFRKRTLSSFQNSNNINFEMGSNKTEDEGLEIKRLAPRRSRSTPMTFKGKKKRKLIASPQSSTSSHDAELEKTCLNDVSVSSSQEMNLLNVPTQPIIPPDHGDNSGSDKSNSSFSEEENEFEKASPLQPVPDNINLSASSSPKSKQCSPSKSQENFEERFTDNSFEFSPEYSDYEEGDDSDMTNLRRSNKNIRYQNRNIIVIPLCEKPENKGFIQDFSDFMKKQQTSTSKTDNNTTTKVVSELFTKEDSLLEFEHKKDDAFTLELLRSFHSEVFRHLVYPLDWVVESCGDNGTKALERLKAHSYLRSYILYEVSQLSSDNDNTIKHDVRENIDALDKQITKSSLYKRYKKKEMNAQNKKKIAKMILNPSKSMDIEQLVSKWNRSFEKSELDKDFQFIFDRSMESEDISVRNLTRYAQYARINLLLRLCWI